MQLLIWKGVDIMKHFGRFIKELGHRNNVGIGVVVGVAWGAVAMVTIGLYAWIYSAWDESKDK